MRDFKKANKRWWQGAFFSSNVSKHEKQRKPKTVHGRKLPTVPDIWREYFPTDASPQFV